MGDTFVSGNAWGGDVAAHVLSGPDEDVVSTVAYLAKPGRSLGDLLAAAPE
jgi:hypothetical protein